MPGSNIVMWRGLLAAVIVAAGGACHGDRLSPGGGLPGAGGHGGNGGNGGDGGSTAPSGPPAGWDREVSVAGPVDLNPDPHVLEVNLEASPASLAILPGTTTDLWAYNHELPGPLLRAQAGDRVVVHFTNHLPEATTVHWHGVRLDAAMDGTPSAQPPVEPGATFDYDFVVPDAGLYWYHPHMRSNVQVASGLYGALLVDDPDERRDFGDEVVLVLSDIALGADGRLPAPDPNDTVASIWGREGNNILVNGRIAPRLLAERGRRQRWRLVNAAVSRYFNLDFGQTAAPQVFTRIGGDGGLMQTPITGDTLLLTPGQRADVVVAPDAPAGTRLAVRWLPYDRGFGTDVGRVPAETFSVSIAREASGQQAAAIPSALRPIAPLDVTAAGWACNRYSSPTPRAATPSTASRSVAGRRARCTPPWAPPTCGRCRTTPSSTTRFTCTASSFRCSTT